MTILCPNKPPTRLLGNYLVNTIFGQCLIGKISGSTRLTDSKTVSQLSIVNIATIHNDEISNNKTLDICSRRAASPLKLSSTDMGLFQNEYKSTAINVRSPQSIGKNKISDNLESLDSNVQTSMIPSLIFLDTKFAQNVSKANSTKIMYPNADKSKPLSKRFKFDVSDVCKIPLNPLYVSVKFIFFISFFLKFIVGAGLLGSTESARYVPKYDTWEPLSTEVALLRNFPLNFFANYRIGHQFFKHQFKDKFSLSVLDSREGNFSNYEFEDYSKVVIYLTHNVPGLVNSEIRDITHPEKQCYSGRRLHVLLELSFSFWLGCYRGNVYFGMLNPFAVYAKPFCTFIVNKRLLYLKLDM